MLNFLARAFLENSAEVDIHGNIIPELSNTTNASLEDAIVTQDDINDTFDGVETVADVRAMLEETDSIFTIQFLYPLVGSLPILLSFGKLKIFKPYLNKEKAFR